LALALVLIVRGSAAADLDAEINALEEARYAALLAGDSHAFANLLGEDFFYNTATGLTLTKDQYVTQIRTGDVKVRAVRREPAKVFAYGDLALITGVSHVDVTVNGEDKTLDSRYLHVWARQSTGWKLVARQATSLPK
jgi:ketosteroid isomerase-like protein